MLRLNPVKSEPCRLCRLAISCSFRPITRGGPVCGSILAASSNVHHGALILFGFHDGGKRFPLLYWPNVGDQGCLDLDARPVIAADPESVFTTPAPQMTGAACFV